MSYDGRHPDIPWREQDIETVGYHYYMTPETAELGLKKLPNAIKNKPTQWTINDWPDVSKMKVFNNTLVNVPTGLGRLQRPTILALTVYEY